MKTRPLDKTKKTNIKCEHCKYYANFPTMACDNRNSKLYGECRMYCNRCKFFEWHARYDHPTEKGSEG